MKIFVIVFSSLVILGILWGITELKLLKVTEYEIKDDNVPKSLKGKKIAVVSDLHEVYHGKDNIRLLDKLKNIAADYIIVSGDVINGRSEKELIYLEHTLSSLSQLGAKVIYTFGNHEEKMAVNLSSKASYEKLLKLSAEYSLLLNDKGYVPETDNDVCFIGINLPLWLYHDHDRIGLIRGKIKEIIDANDANNKYKILIAHDPEHFDKYAESGVNLCLCGHLHGGIIRVPFLGGLITPRMQIFKRVSKGYFEKGKMKMIISGGVGWHDLPIRILNRPEIVVINF